jgi:two-component system sensor histidine kinase/response regulator
VTFFEVNLDYVYFLSGLSLVSLGAVAAVLVMERQQTLRWIWLALFGICIGLTTWAACFGLTLGDTTIFAWIRFVGSALAYTAFLEFGRSSFADLYPRVPGRWATAALGVVALGAAAFGLVNASLVVRFMLALPAGLLAGAAAIARGVPLLRSEEGIVRRSGRMLCGAGASLIAYAGCVAAFGDGILAAARGSAAWIGSVPVEGVLACLVFVAANEFLGFSAASHVLRGEIPGLHRAFTRFYAVAVMLVVVAIGGFAVSEAGSIAETQARGTLLQRALTAAASVDAERLASLKGDPSDAGGADYAYVLEELEDMHAVNADMRYMYLLRRIGGRVVFLMDSSALGGDGVSRPGVVYDEASPELLALLSGEGDAFVEGPAADSFGNWVTAFVPIREDGRLLAVLGMDLPSAKWMASLSNSRATAIALVLVTSVLLLGAMGLVQATRDTQHRTSASERRLHSILASAPDGIAILEPKTHRIEFANPTLASMLGIEHDSLVGLQMDTLMSDDGESVCVAVDTGAVTMSERKMLTASGGPIDVEMTCMHISVDDADRLLVYVHDVSERALHERALQDRITLENIIRAVSSRFLSSDASDVSAVVSEALATLGTFLDVDRVHLSSCSRDGLATATHEWCASGTPPLKDQLQGIRMDGFPWFYDQLRANEFVRVANVDEMPAEAAADRALLLSQGIRSQIVVPLIESDRLVGYLSVDSVRGDREWSGDRIAMLTVFGDVLSVALRRARAETELAKLTIAVTNSPAATAITDVDGAIEYVNPRFRELSGYSSVELIGQNPRILKSGTTGASVYKELWRVITAGGDWRGEFVNKRKDGTHYDVTASISPVRDPAGQIHYVCVQEDITALKIAEVALRESADAAQAANRAKSDFLATMSHEIRTPMNAIIGMAELLDETPLNEEQQRYIRIFRSAGESLLTLINDILDLSKIEAGAFEIEEREFDVEQLIEETAEVLAMRGREKGIELLVDIEPGVPPVVLGDPHRLRQVLVNLMGNAIKFTQVGHVLLSVSPIQAGSAPSVRFAVSDTGIGIAPSKLETIFEAFTQADSSTTRKYGGTGLGLTISRRLVELMGGRLTASSEVGTGSTFAFTLPAGETSSVPAGEAADDVRLVDIHALVIDDSETNRLILRRYLEQAGATVDEAAEGQAGVACLLAPATAYDVVLTDLRMPEMSGFDVTSAIAGDPRTAGVPVIILSSDARPGDSQVALEAGAAALLMKPVRRRTLLDAVAAACRPIGRPEGPSVASPPAAVDAPEPAVDTPVKALSILLVEDTDDNRLLALAYLKNTPHRVVSAGNGVEAVDAYQAAGAEGFDLVLMDMQMPVMDGYAATRKIRQIETAMHLPHTPIIALTAYALAEETSAAIKAGCDDYLTKPIKKATLLDAVARYSGA